MLTLPNLLTFGRIALIPLLVAAFYLDAPSAVWVTFGLFAAAAVSDFLDGWLARRLDQHSALGRVLDPIADKLLVAAALVMLAAEGRAAEIAVAAILCREVLISGLRESLAGRLAIPVSPLAKWKTASQMLAIGVLLVAPAFALPLDLAGGALLWLAVALSWLTALDYLRAALRHLRAQAPAEG